MLQYSHVPQLPVRLLGSGAGLHSDIRLGATGKSTWEIEFVDFNIYHIVGALSKVGATAPGANYTTVDGATGQRWQLVIEAANLSHFNAQGSAPTPTAERLAFPEGTGANIIGYEDRPARPGVMVVTFLEVQ